MKTTITIDRNFNGSFSLSEMYSSEYDEDGHEEDFLNEFYSEYPKNAMFI